MIKEIEKLTSAVRNPFMLLSFLSVFLISLFTYVLNQQANLPFSIVSPLLVFLGILFTICVASFIILLFRDPTRLFIKDISDLKKEHERLMKTNSDIIERLSTAEQALLPIIRGRCLQSLHRLRSGRLVIGTKQFDEQIILGHIVMGQIETQIPAMKCELLTPNGGTLKNFADLINGWIDGYIEYTGTGCTLLNIDPAGRSLEQVLVELDAESRKRYNITWLKPLGLRNNYKIVVRSDKAKALRLQSIPDLARSASRLKFCSV